MRYRFTLGGYTILEDQPRGWEQLEVKMLRDSFENAMYLIYTSPLTFWGEGWNYCKNVIDTVGICGKVEIQIEIDRYDTGKYKNLFPGNGIGFADFTEAQIDYERCEATVTIKDNIVMKLLADRLDTDIYMPNRFWETNAVGHTQGGANVAVDVNNDGVIISTNTIARKIGIHDIVTGVTAPSTALTRTAYKVIDMLRYLAAALTENQVRVESDFFTQQHYQQEKWEITIGSGVMGAGDIYTITFKTSLGKAWTLPAIPFTTNQAVTLGLIADALLEATNLDLDPAPEGPYFATYQNFSNDRYSYSEVQGGIQIVVESFIPTFDLDVACNNAVVFVCNKTQDCTYGMKNLFVGFNTEITGKRVDGSHNMNFGKLFTALDDRFNLGMALQQTGTDEYILRVEPKGYFFSNPEIVDVGGVMNIKSEPNKDMSIKGLVVGNKGSDFFFGVTGRKQNWFVDQCDTGTTDKSSQANYDIAAIGEQISVNNFAGSYPIKNQDDISFILIEPGDVNKGLVQSGGGTVAFAAKYPIKLINEAPVPTAPDYTLYVFNAGLINYWAVFYHLYSIAGVPMAVHADPTFILYNWTINNNNEANQRRNYEFETILTHDAMQAIFNQPWGSVGFSKDPANHLSKGIYELTWSVNSGKTTFKLFG